MKRHHVFLHKKNLLRDLVLVTISIGLAYGFIANLLRTQKQNESQVADNPTAEEMTGESQIDMTDWADYKDEAYGFEVKYPKHWNRPTGKFGGKGDRWEYRYQFRKGLTDDKSNYIGFDVVIYDVEKVKEVFATDEFPKAKNENTAGQDVCQNLEGHVLEGDDYAVNQISVEEGDDCFNQAHFYNIVRDEYIYNIVSVLSGEKDGALRPEKETALNFPEFLVASETFNLIDIKELPKTVPPAKKRISAPMPYVFAVDSLGRKVCDKGKKDKPGKSKKGKKHHMDMECCLDPDEDPNPHCYYPPEKYGKYL